MKTPDDILQPGGVPIGTEGSHPRIREVSGGMKAAADMFNDLSGGRNDITPVGYPGKLVELPGKGVVGLRIHSKSGPPTIDVNISGIAIDKVKFL